MDGKELPFKLDTGAEVTAVSKETWQILGKPALQPPNKHLLGPAQQPLAVLGCFSLISLTKDEKFNTKAFVAAWHLEVRADVVQTAG